MEDEIEIPRILRGISCIKMFRYKQTKDILPHIIASLNTKTTSSPATRHYPDNGSTTNVSNASTCKHPSDGTDSSASLIIVPEAYTCKHPSVCTDSSAKLIIVPEASTILLQASNISDITVDDCNRVTKQKGEKTINPTDSELTNNESAVLSGPRSGARFNLDHANEQHDCVSQSNSFKPSVMNTNTSTKQRNSFSLFTMIYRKLKRSDRK